MSTAHPECSVYLPLYVDKLLWSSLLITNYPVNCLRLCLITWPVSDDFIFYREVMFLLRISRSLCTIVCATRLFCYLL